MISNPMPSLIVHGHFYQPPRWNAWSGEPELEESAAPAHDWNQRINAECYRANAWARIAAPDGRVVDMVNNYAWMSFNVGPTLAEWLERFDPATYARILEADRDSLERLGHGNAMAQPYNHAILPLCNARDRRTQIRWGIDDFRKRFRRKPEGMWLSETAIDDATLDELAAAGIKFTILAPEQAAGPVDSARVYRCRGVAIFFFDGPVSREVSFGDVSQNGEALATRLASTRPLTLVATDGETYGHHKKFSDLTLAYVLTRAMPERGIDVTNPAAWLARHRHTPWVGLKAGGTSWSCSHGVERWRANCGCSTGGPPGWNQKWRAPLRDAFDWLRDRLAEAFEREGRKYFDDPWHARDRYLVAKPRHPRALTLLEVQRHAMLMYTSCGWFFADLSGVEVGIVVQHALRAIELSGLKLERDFMKRLAKAKSNLPGRPDGAALARERVLPRRVTPAQAAAHAAALGVETLERGAYRVTFNAKHATVEGKPAPWKVRVPIRSVPLPPNERDDIRRGLIDQCAAAIQEVQAWDDVTGRLRREYGTKDVVALFRGAPSRAACRRIRAAVKSADYDPVVVQNAFHRWVFGRRAEDRNEVALLAEAFGIAREAVMAWVNR